MTPPDVQQHSDGLLVRGDELQLMYFCLHAGAQKLRRDGLSAARVEQLKAVVHRALMSPLRHDFADSAAAESCSAGQDGDNDSMNANSAAAELNISVRHAQRLAPSLGAVRIGRSWAFRRAPVLGLKRERETTDAS
jgi:hypothetical protein